ncbi:MAG: AtpZ/AtpI family protein [Planctomycetota bacterium]|jgi:F0F1-type ATP synthase assembly protein I
MGLGLVIPVMVSIGCGLGYLADERLGTEPWFLIVGAAVGFALGFTSFLITVLRGEKQAESDRADEER